MSNAALRPSLVTASMLSSLGDTSPLRIASARATSVATNAFSSGSRLGRHRLQMEPRHRQLQHVRSTNIGHFAEHGHQLRQIDEARKPRVHAVAPAIRRQLQGRHRFPEVPRPRIKLRHMIAAQRHRLQIALHGPHFGHRVRYRCSGREYHSRTTALLVHHMARLHEHIEGTFRVGIRQTCNPRHFGEAVQVLEVVRLVDEQDNRCPVPRT